MKLPEIRKQYPEYDDVDDYTLTEALRKKYYPDTPVEKFRDAIGYTRSKPIKNPKTTRAYRRKNGIPEQKFAVEGPLEMRAAYGLSENLDTPYESFKEHNMFGNMVEYAMTPQDVYDRRNSESDKLDKEIAVASVPLLSSLEKVMDKYRNLDNTGELTEEQDAEYTKLEEVYSDLYKAVTEQYEKKKAWDNRKPSTNAGKRKRSRQKEFTPDEKPMSTIDMFNGIIESFKKDAGGTTATFLNALVGSPELLLTPVGWEMGVTKAATIASKIGIKGSKALKAAEITGGISGSSAVGASLAAATSASSQLAKKGEVDADEVILAAKVGAVTAPVLIGAFKGIGSGVSKVVKGPKVEYNTIIGSIVPAPKKLKAVPKSDKLTPEQQVKLTEELLPLAGNRLTKVEAKNLTYELRDLTFKLNKLKDTSGVGTAVPKVVKAKVYHSSSKRQTLKDIKKAKEEADLKNKRAETTANRANTKAKEEFLSRNAEDIALLEERIALIKGKIEANDVAVVAEKALSRVEQGLPPEPIKVDMAPESVPVPLASTKATITRPVVEKYITKIGQRAAKYMQDGLKEDVAIERAINYTVKSPALREALYARGKIISKTFPEENVDKVVGTVGKALDKLQRGKITALDKLSDYIGSASTTMRNISQVLAYRMQRHDMDLALRMKDALLIKTTFADEIWSKLTPRQQSKLSLALANQDRAAALKLVEGTTNGKELLGQVFKYLDDTEAEAIELGVTMGSVRDYFPRSVKDYEGLIKGRGYTKSDLQKALAFAINKKWKLTKSKSKYSDKEPIENAWNHLTRDEFEGAVDKMLAGTFKEVSARSGSVASKRRTMKAVSREDLANYYHDPITALTDYIAAMSMKLETRRFFGGKAMDDGSLAGKIGTEASDQAIKNSIGKLTTQLLKDGEILESDIGKIQYLLNARFVGGAKAPNNAIGIFRDIGYALTIANPLSAGTQLGDLGAATYLNGVVPSVRAIGSKLSPNKKHVTMEDLGLSNLVEELEHLRPTAKLLEGALRFSGFKLVDRLGKETVLNSSLIKLRSQIKTPKGRAQIESKYSKAFTPEEFNKAMSDLESGTLGTEVKFMLWTDLARVQPISLSEMPPVYLNNANARVFYMLKSFTIKQLDILRRDAYDQIRSGNVKGGMTNLLRHVAILGLANAQVQMAKDWVAGKDVEFSDVLIATILRNYGTSAYTLNKIAEGNALAAIGSLALPPISAYDETLGAPLSGDYMTALGHLPPWGKLIQLMAEEK